MSIKANGKILYFSCKDNKNLEKVRKIMEFSMVYNLNCSIMTTPLFSLYI